MFDPLSASMQIAGSGLAAQSVRLRIVSENIANADSTSALPGGDPYSRKTVTFSSILDKTTGASQVEIQTLGTDTSAFRIERNPSHPAADSNGIVKYPNVNLLLEMADMREANRSYEANTQVIKEGRDLLGMTIDLLRSNS